jgi:hypothetical protein
LRAYRGNYVSWSVNPLTGILGEEPCDVSPHGHISQDIEPVLCCTNDDCGISSDNETATASLRDILPAQGDHEVAWLLKQWQPRKG